MILSSPGRPCVWFMGYLDADKLRQDAERYRAAGGKPQVVWPNGVLASLAVGLVVQLLTPWRSARVIARAYLEFDGDNNTVLPSNRPKAVARARAGTIRPARSATLWFDLRPHLTPEPATESGGPKPASGRLPVRCLVLGLAAGRVDREGRGHRRCQPPTFASMDGPRWRCARSGGTWRRGSPG